MNNTRVEEIARHLGVSSAFEKLRRDLAAVPDCVDVDYDLDCMADLHQIIVLPRWDEAANLSRPDYFKRRKKFLQEILHVCAAHGLTRTEDALEDYGGGWFYIVFSCRWKSAEKFTYEQKS